VYRESTARAGLLAEYRTLCATLGRPVRVELPGNRQLTGTAEDVDADGRLLIRETDATSVTPISADDIIHVR
jgi:BirA family biotin operon repressor/biotin-[acetyl-CoA-carboxylase] ligase